MLRGYELYTLHKDRNTKTYHVRLYRQSAWWLWVGSVYHWYDTHIEKVPGVKWIEGLINKRRLKRGWEHYIPIYAARDIRCYYLNRKSRVEIKDFEVTEEEYNRLK
jgi:hypothetical protein